MCPLSIKFILWIRCHPDAAEDRRRWGAEGPKGGQPGEDGQRQGAESLGSGGQLPPGWDRQQRAAQRLAQEEVPVRPGARWQEGKIQFIWKCWWSWSVFWS